MKPKIVLIATSLQPTLESYERERLQGLDFLPRSAAEIARQVAINAGRIMLRIDDTRMNLLDLINYCRQGRRGVELTPDNPESKPAPDPIRGQVLEENLSLARLTPLTGIYLADSLRKRGFETRLIHNFAIQKERLAEALQEDPTAVALSTTHIGSLSIVREIGRFVRRHNSQVPIIVGGSLVYQLAQQPPRVRELLVEKLLEGCREEVDIFVLNSQGEETLGDVARALAHRTPLEEVKNLAYFQDGRLRYTPAEPEDHRLDEHWICWDRFEPQEIGQNLSILTGRGCPFRCKFCTFWQLTPRVELKSIEGLRQELRSLSRLGRGRHLMVVDDLFNVTEERAAAVCRMMIEEEFGFSWSCFGRIDQITQGTARLMREAGCEYVHLGIESGDERILRNMNKGIHPSQILKGIELLKGAGLVVSGTFIVGFPGETQESLEKTIALIDRSGLDLYKLLLFRYHPSMPIYQERKQYGLQGGGEVWSHATMDVLQASAYLPEICSGVSRAYFEGGFSPWPVYAHLREAGYSSEDILEFFRIYSELVKLDLAAGPGNSQGLHRKEALLGALEARIGIKKEVGNV